METPSRPHSESRYIQASRTVLETLEDPPSDLDRAAVLESFRLIVPALRFMRSANDACGDLTDSHRQ
jgi:hypothetical protein